MRLQRWANGAPIHKFWTMKKFNPKIKRHNNIKRTKAVVGTKVFSRINYKVNKRKIKENMYKVNKRKTSKTRFVSYVAASNLFTSTNKRILSGDFQRELLRSF